MIELYGIPNCDTVKKAVSWLRQNGLEFRFHDYKKEGITKAKLQEWCRQFGWENVLNKQGTTWRKSSAEEQAAINNEKKAIAYLVKNTSAIRRPIIKANGKYLIKFNEDEFGVILLKDNGKFKEADG